MTVLERLRILLWAFAETVAETVGGMRHVPASFWLAICIIMWAGLAASVVVG